MNFESIEQLRYETTKAVMESMAKFAADSKNPFAERIKAAKLVDGMSDSVIKAYLLTKVTDDSSDNNKKLINQLDKLTDKED